MNFCGIEGRAGKRSYLSRVLFALILLGGSGCSAVYPEVTTRIVPVPSGAKTEPPPPPDVLYLGFREASIPAQTRDGVKWDSVGGNAPDPFAKVILDKKDLFATPTQPNTLHPTWPDQTWANYRVRPGGRLLIELWDTNPIANRPICRTTLNNVHAHAAAGEVELLCNGGARVTLGVEPGRAMMGLGFSYEVGNQEARVTKVLQLSPAGRAGLEKGMRLVRVQGKDVAELDAAELKSAINANARTGVECVVERRGEQERTVVLKEEAVYPLASEGVPLR